jgi:hypothetical protein
MKKTFPIGAVVKYSRPMQGEETYRFLVYQDRGDRVAIEIVCSDRIRPIEVVAKNEIELAGDDTPTIF